MSEKNQGEKTNIAIKDLLCVLQRKWQLLGAITVAFFVIALSYLLMAAPTYESTALLQVKLPQDATSVVAAKENANFSQQLQEAISKYETAINSGSVQKRAAALLQEKGSAVADLGALTVTRLKDSALLELTLKSDSPTNAQASNKALLAALSENTAIPSFDTEAAAKLAELRKSLALAKEDCRKSQSALDDFKRANQAFSPDTSQAEIVARLRDLSAEKAEASANFQAAEAGYLAVKEQLEQNGAALAANALLTSYQNKIMELEISLAEYRSKYTERHPAVIKVKEELAALRQAVDEEVARIKAGASVSLNSTYQNLLKKKLDYASASSAVAAKLEAIAKKEAECQKEAAQLADLEKEFTRLKQNAAQADSSYQVLAKQLAEAEAKLGTTLQLIEPPTLPMHSAGGGKLWLAVLVVLLGFGGGCIYVLVKELPRYQAEQQAARPAEPQDEPAATQATTEGEIGEPQPAATDDDEKAAQKEAWERKLQLLSEILYLKDHIAETINEIKNLPKPKANRVEMIMRRAKRKVIDTLAEELGVDIIYYEQGMTWDEGYPPEVVNMENFGGKGLENEDLAVLYTLEPTIKKKNSYELVKIGKIFLIEKTKLAALQKEE